MSGGAAAQTMRASAVRINHRWKRFAGANALKKIALNVIAKVRRVDTFALPFFYNASRCVVFLTGRPSESAFCFEPRPVGWGGNSRVLASRTGGDHAAAGVANSPTLSVESLPNGKSSFYTPRKWLLAFIMNVNYHFSAPKKLGSAFIGLFVKQNGVIRLFVNFVLEGSKSTGDTRKMCNWR